MLLEKTAAMRSDLSTMNTSLSLQFLEKELLDMEDRIVPLKRQSSYTLLMMRIVEIGLPIILSLFSLFFVMRYSLTEERLQEIKMLLRARNAKRDQQQ